MPNSRINNIRDLNKKRILEFVVSNQPTTRVIIAKEIKLTKATVSAIVAELVEDKILIESELFESTGGRKAAKILVNKDLYTVIAIDYSRGHIKGATINLNGEILHKEVVKTRNELEIKTTLEDTYNLIDILLSKLSNKDALKAISISIDGSVDRNQNIRLAHAKGWFDLNLNKFIEEKYKVKAYTNNEANLAAIGENSFFRQIEDLTMISMHTGVGLGSIQHNQLITGFDGLAGEIGHTIVNVNGIPCSCGNNGCIEQYVSVASIKNNLSVIKKRPIQIKDIIHLYNDGDLDTTNAVNLYCKYLGVLITNSINLINPNELIIANDLLDAMPNLLQSALKYVNLTVSSCNNIRLSSSNDIELLGAAVIAIKDILSIRHYYPSMQFSKK